MEQEILQKAFSEDPTEANAAKLLIPILSNFCTVIQISRMRNADGTNKMKKIFVYDLKCGEKRQVSNGDKAMPVHCGW